MNRLSAFAFVLVTALAATAFAGAKGANNVWVSPTAAVGDLGQARNSTDTNQWIGCYTQAYKTSNGYAEQVTCEATDANGKSVSCYSPSPELVREGRAVAGDSYLYFSKDAAGLCTTILSQRASLFAPKQP